ncbi:heme-binding protein 2-like [Haliotis rufescens]|uniref:heme-binding protein 2-like n=1 Tax=Haliotis rufescens TaxID=6454 RepID=UPI00201F0955|nr:heme-binding protein 2-like [Haliotis rufescens]
MMSSQVVLQLGLVGVLLAACAHAQNMTVMCYYFDCPSYSKTAQRSIYEERVYANERWVATSGDVRNLETSRLQMFNRLLSYLSGANVQSKALNITLPFLTKVVRAPGSDVTTDMTMYMYIPLGSQSAPPTPSDPKVTVVSSPVTYIFSTSFGGYTSKSGVKKTRKDLFTAIGDARRYDDSHFYLATYSSPLQMKNRYNELWMVRK